MSNVNDSQFMTSHAQSWGRDFRGSLFDTHRATLRRYYQPTYCIYTLNAYCSLIVYHGKIKSSYPCHPGPPTVGNLYQL